MTAPAAVALLVLVAVLLWPGAGPPRRHEPVRAADPTGPRWWRGRGPRARAAVDAELFAAALDAGLPVAEATAWAGGPGAGAGHDDALAWWRREAPAVGRALLMSESLGSPAADLVRSAADAERERRALEAELSSGLAGVRATAWLLTALPVAGAVLGPVLAGGAASGPVVPLATGAGLALTGVGWWVLRRLVARARREALA